MNRDDTVKGLAGKHSRNKILKTDLYFRVKKNYSKVN